MQILSVNSYNSGNFKKTISFGAQKRSDYLEQSDKSKLDECVSYYKNLVLEVADTNCEAYDEEIAAFMRTIKKSSKRVQSKFLLQRHFSDELSTPFEYALFEDNSYVAEKLWDLVKDIKSYDIQSQFILGDRQIPENTAYMLALSCGEFDLANDILAYIASMPDERLKQRFFALKSPTKESQFKYETQYDILIRRGMFDEAAKFAGIAKKLKIPYSCQIVDQESSSKAKDDDKTSKNYRVYDEVKTRFSDIGGMFNVKRQIENELLAILKNPKVKNSDKPSGVILYGPPGTGKTLLATAIAGEAGVPFISTSGSGFAEIYVGSGPKNVRKLYQEARELASKHDSKTAIVFIDEVDAVGAARGQSSSSERDNTLNALLCEMDGVQSKEDSDVKIITILATNRKDMLDSAFRKGRIDLEFKIDDPRFSKKARYEILKVHAKGKPFQSESKKEELLNNLAESTQGFSGAELADVIKRAYRKTLYLGREKEYITVEDLNDAKLESMVGISNDTEDTDYERKSVIAHEAGHAINLIVMNKVLGDEKNLSQRPMRVLDLIVNDSRGGAAGITFSKPSTENGRMTIESLLSSVVVTYGGYSAEEALYGCHTDGVSGDLESNTERIFNAVMKYGLGSKTKYLCVKPDGHVFDLYKSNIKEDVEAYSKTGMKISEQISKFVKPFVEQYAEKYLHSDVKVIKGDEFSIMFETWLSDSGKQNEYDKLCRQIRKEIKDLRNKMDK